MLAIMAIEAIALLRIPSNDVPASALFRALDDGALVRTRADFAADPAEIAIALRRSAGDHLDRHRDPRGILVLPDVAAPIGETYDAVAEEIGEGGTWIALAELESAEGDDADGGDLLATMMSAMTSPAMQDAIARARDALSGLDPATAGDAASARERMADLARSMSAGIPASPGGETDEAMRALAERHGGALGGEGEGVDLGALMRDPAFQQMVDGVRQQLLADPGKMAELAALFGAEPDGEGAEEDGESEAGDDGDGRPS